MRRLRPQVDSPSLKVLQPGTPFAPSSYADCRLANPRSDAMVSKSMIGSGKSDRPKTGRIGVPSYQCHPIAYSMNGFALRGVLTNSCYSSTLTSLSRTELRRTSPTPDYRRRFVQRKAGAHASPQCLLGFPQSTRSKARRQFSEVRWVRVVTTSTRRSCRKSAPQPCGNMFAPNVRSLTPLRTNHQRGEVEVRFDLGGVCV